jgi:Ca-activated chloride channel family protein
LRFQYPHLLIFLAIIPLLAWIQTRRGKGRRGMPFSDLSPLKGYMTPLSRRVVSRLYLAAIALLIIAMARPLVSLKPEEEPTEGVSIVLAIDVSGSMKKEDRDRLRDVKDLAKEFVKGRKADRIGLVAFARTSLMVTPVTSDYKVLSDSIDSLNFGMLQEGTALGEGIINGVNRLRDVEGKAKAVILLSDGLNNSGDMDPIEAASIAKAVGVRIYTIEESAVENYLAARQTGNWGVDTDILRAVSEVSGGVHFKIPNRRRLLTVFKEIDGMERDILGKRSFRDAGLLPYLITLAILLVMLELMLLGTRFRGFP